jgi:hypothetical protein
MRPATFDTDRSVTDSTQSTAVAFQNLPDSAVSQSAQLAIDSVDVSGETIRL